MLVQCFDILVMVGPGVLSRKVSIYFFTLLTNYTLFRETFLSRNETILKKKKDFASLLLQ